MLRLRPITVSLVLLGGGFAFSAPALAADHYPIYTDNTFSDLAVYGLEIAPGLEADVSQGSITASPSVDERIWNLAYARGYQLQRSATASRLVWIDGYRLQPEAAGAWSDLKAAASREGHRIALTSAYRTLSDQKSIFLSKLYGTSTSAITLQLAHSAPPGASRHHTGYAIDVRQVGGSHGGFANTAAFKWISANNYENAKRFGFVPSYPPDATNQGPNAEPWEYVFVGDDVLFHDGPFSDVLPNHLFVTEIAWLSDQDITRGCTADGLRFCPYGTVDRGQISAFVKRAFELPGSAVDYFVDDNSSIFEGDINAVAEAGVVRGCDPPANTRYCPLLDVDRGAMAALLRRGLQLPASQTDHFTDDDSSIFEGDINALADAGITTGCGGGSFCPTRSVTRDEFAAMLFRSRDWLP